MIMLKNVYWYFNGFPMSQASPVASEDVTSDDADELIVNKTVLHRVHENLWVGESAETLCILPSSSPHIAAKAYMSALYMEWVSSCEKRERALAEVAEIEGAWFRVEI